MTEADPVLAPVFQAIRERFRDQVATPAGLSVVHDNGPEPTKSTAWARVSVLIDSTAQASIGAPVRFRSRGAAVVNLSIAGEKGDARLLQITDQIIAAFRGVSLPDPQVRFDSPTPTGAPTLDGPWFTRTVRIPFIADTYLT